MRSLIRLALPLALLLLAACSESSALADPSIAAANPVLGQLSFEQSCSGCHASNDGFDLRTFRFSDTTIVRRAVKHVDSAAARNIAAYIRKLPAPSISEHARLFQPGGSTVAGDVEFAVALFGRDAWPADLTSAGLIAINPRNVRVAISLPIWSDERSNLDWMPDFGIPAGILDYSGGLARGAVAGYRASPTTDNLIRAVNALRNADRAVANPQAPCLLEDTLRVKYRTCFEVRRWTSSLVALHMLRNGMTTEQLGGKLQDVWWDVGNAARKSRKDNRVPIANVDQNWATWMLLGWSFDPSLHSSFYTGGAFRQLGLMRHATFVALRSEVARSRNSANVYEDVLNAVKYAPNDWAAPVTLFGLRHLDERLKSGERPATADAIATAITQVNSSLTEAYRKVSMADRTRIDAAAQPVLAALRAIGGENPVSGAL